MIKLPPDETTPLTNNGNGDAKPSSSTPSSQRGPIYVFPGVSPYYVQRQHFIHFQWCISITFTLIFLSALLIVLSLLSENRLPPSSNVALLANITNYTDSSAIESETEKDSRDNNILALKQNEIMKKLLPDEPVDGWALKRWHLNVTDGKQAVNIGIKALGDREMFEEGLQPESVHTPSFRHYRSLNTNAESRKLARRGYVENHATKHIADIFNYTHNKEERSSIGSGPKISIPDPTADVNCDFNAKYRKSNGICNNKQNPRLYGAALVPYRRMVNPDYADGIMAPRGSYENETILPSARNVSLKIHRSSYETDSKFTVMLAVFGQFLDHDITATSITTSQEGQSINCCLKPNQNHPECFPVIILPDDPYYSKFNITCMNFVRSAPAPTGHFGPRQQLNQATSFIDGSVIYGNSEYRQQHLRTMMNGTLRMFKTDDGRELLPLSTDLEDGCNRVQMAVEGKYCFESGDDRANENLLLTSMHLLWARHHNYLARGLQIENPYWDDETIFQETRKITSAQLAHIAYNEFLPILLGKEMMKEKYLSPQPNNSTFLDTYDSNVNPTLANDFAAAAFRFAHTLLPGLFNMTRDDSAPEAIELHKMLFNPFSLWHSKGIDNALLAACNTPIQRVDRFFSIEITQKLFEDMPEDRKPICGLDLVSLNIQRGRDHGLPGYSVYRRHCKLPPADTWEDMANIFDVDTLTSIKEIYKSPHDVDFYTGALSEAPLRGALIGPLLACVISDQFLRLKLGDSHWYERKIGPQKFTKDQLNEIYKTTLSQIICQNADNITRIRKYVMQHYTNDENIIMDCPDITAFNFTPWNNEKNHAQLFRTSFNVKDTNVRIFQDTPMQLKSNHTLQLET